MDDEQQKSFRQIQEEAVRNLRQCAEINEMGQHEIARALRARYDGYLKAGFTEQQAFELIRARGLAL